MQSKADEGAVEVGETGGSIGEEEEGWWGTRVESGEEVRPTNAFCLAVGSEEVLLLPLPAIGAATVMSVLLPAEAVAASEPRASRDGSSVLSLPPPATEAAAVAPAGLPALELPAGELPAT